MVTWGRSSPPGKETAPFGCAVGAGQYLHFLSLSVHCTRSQHNSGREQICSPWHPNHWHHTAVERPWRESVGEQTSSSHFRPNTWPSTFRKVDVQEIRAENIPLGSVMCFLARRVPQMPGRKDRAEASRCSSPLVM